MAKARTKQTTVTGNAGSVEINTAALSASSVENAQAVANLQKETATSLNWHGVNGLTPDVLLGYLVSTHPKLKGFSVFIPSPEGEEIQVPVTNTIMQHAINWAQSEYRRECLRTDSEAAE